jgi:sugar (pentulose or hexulose) kinase
MNVIAVFDVGKTNKKLFLFDEDYHIVFERSARFNEIEDEDGFACENLDSLKTSVLEAINEISHLKEFELKAVNFSAYGASFVLLNEEGEPIAPLYNYLKPYPENLSAALYDKYNGEESFSLKTASPLLGSLNSALQLYRLKMEQPQVFKKLKYALHLPQYLSFLLTGCYCSDLSSIGCHTAMWDFGKGRYHDWITKEGIEAKLAPIEPSTRVHPASFPGTNCQVGIGLHDSSAALIPYLVNFHEPFILISTGTWCISLNPFNHDALTKAELQSDCLSYIQYNGKPVKASRLFSGFEHEQQVKRIATYFNQNTAKYRDMPFDNEVIKALKEKMAQSSSDTYSKQSVFGGRNLADFKNDVEAYHQLIIDLVNLQTYSTSVIIADSKIKRIFVDGGFSKNKIFMNLLAMAFPNLEVFAASMAQASAVGAALAIHPTWNKKPIPADIIQLQYYSANNSIEV